jgi:hypothetical protein
MEYFLCIDNTPYHHWQTELLLESFRHHDLQEQLLISIVPTGDEGFVDYNINLIDHPRNAFANSNIGRERGYDKLNTLYSLLAVLENGILEAPFAMIQPDMVLHHPIEDGASSFFGGDDQYHISFQVDPSLSVDNVEEAGCEIKKHLDSLCKKHGVSIEDVWLPIGNTIVFHMPPISLVGRVIAATEKLCIEQLEKTGTIWKHTDRVAWAHTLLEYYGEMSYNASYEYEMNMLENTDMRNFVNYEHGIPPIFSKYMFRYQKPNYVAFSAEPPLEFLAGQNMAVSAASHYVQQLAEAYVARKKIKTEELEKETS